MAQDVSQSANMDARMPGNISVSMLKLEIMKTAWPMASSILQGHDNT
jgi:hypothetical protein